MDLGDLRGLITLVTFVTYLGIFWWAYASRNKERFERDALLPFQDGPDGAPAASPEDEEART